MNIKEVINKIKNHKFVPEDNIFLYTTQYKYGETNNKDGYPYYVIFTEEPDCPTRGILEPVLYKCNAVPLDPEYNGIDSAWQMLKHRLMSNLIWFFKRYEDFKNFIDNIEHDKKIFEIVKTVKVSDIIDLNSVVLEDNNIEFRLLKDICHSDFYGFSFDGNKITFPVKDLNNALDFIVMDYGELCYLKKELSHDVWEKLEVVIKTCQDFDFWPVFNLLGEKKFLLAQLLSASELKEMVFNIDMYARVKYCL